MSTCSKNPNVDNKWELNVGQVCDLENLRSRLWEMSATLHLAADHLNAIEEGNGDLFSVNEVVRGAAGRAARLTHVLCAVLDALQAD